MRSFTLINNKGQRWDLNESNSFLHEVKGLGQEHKVSYIQLGDSFIKEKDVLAQKSVQGKIKFGDYDDFHSFSLFIQHKPLTLVYESAARYMMNVSIDRLTKAEKSTLGVLSDITMKSLGSYYRAVIKENTRKDVGAGKKYPHTFPYTYFDTAKGEIVVNSDTVLDSPTIINIFGFVKNPSFIHYVNNEIVTTGKVNATIEAGNKLVINTTKIPYEIAEYTINNEFVRDLYEKSDWNTGRFVLLKNGENKISFVHETSEPIDISVEAHITYESV